MPRLTIHTEPVHATPKNFPVDRLHKLMPRLEKYLKNDLGKLLQRDMEDTVKNWTHKPTMEKKVTRPYRTRLQLTIEPKGRGTTNWRRISEGTPKRTIRAKTPRGMSFQEGYRPKTTTRGKYGGSGKRYGKWRRNVKQVKHEIKPRKFTTRIIKKRQSKIHRDVTSIVRKTARKGFF